MICHNVVYDSVKNEYQGSSPDEVCFISYAKSIGYTFLRRTKKMIEFNNQDVKNSYELIDIIPFTNRKRMSVIVRNISKRG